MGQGKVSYDVKFCQRCGSYLTTIELDGKETLGCPKCRTEAEPEARIQKVSQRTEAIVTISENEGNMNALPTTSVTCERCGNGEASYWQVQTRGGDEPMTRFYRCTKCSLTWREYS
ncbi:transcription factor S [[Eubacterium] cellulosolvens]